MSDEKPVDFKSIRAVLNELAESRVLKTQMTGDYMSTDVRMAAMDIYIKAASALVEVDRRIEELEQGKVPQKLSADVQKFKR
jgi:hypothetical protein